MEKKQESSNTEAVGEPKHTTGHSTAVIKVSDTEFMCPECGETFKMKEATEEHLHLSHLHHLRDVHHEFHSKDVVGHHVE